MRALISLVLCAALVSPVAAETTGQVRGKILIAPLTAAAEGGAPIGPVEALLLAEIQRSPDVSVISAAEARQATKRLKRRDLEDCDGRPECLAELGRTLGAAWVVAGETTPLPEGQVLYLKLVEVEGQKEVSSTTAVIDPRSPAARGETRAAVTRLLRPGAYVGVLLLKLDVNGATVFVDGKRMAPSGPLTVAVGTHALRVTHPQYRDFVRFVDVAFDQKVSIDVELKRYPIVADSMRQDRRDVQPVEPVRSGRILPRPWYRKWWAVAGLGALVLVGTATITYYTDPGVQADREVTVDDQ